MSTGTITTEQAFEEAIETSLRTQGGYLPGKASDWSRELALDRNSLFAFVQATQPDAWDKLTGIHGQDVEIRFLSRLVKELDNRGTLDVLRHGIVDYGVRFHLAYFRPATGLNPTSRELYESNRLTVTRQVYFSDRTPHDSVDMVLCVNGLPIATLELKNHFTGQTTEHARKQYMTDRDPREPLFSFKRRALVHFAVDPDEVWMTTRLNGRETRFLPFNKGYKDGAGNPPNPHGHKTAYLWEDILSRDSLLDILGHYAHLQQDELYFGGRTIKRESLIFPRYHQLDVVRLLTRTVRADGAGNNYLIQHSAGSGKSNSIAWLAHSLASLHNEQNEPIFDSVVVISDRRVLDKQLQDTIYQFDHKQGVVMKIDEDSNQLVRALESGVKIIITTQQKFPFVVNKIENLPVRKYAVIVDEAHSSQTGDAADRVKETLSTEYNTDDNDGDSGTSVEDRINKRLQERRAKQENMSFFAFTATPKPKTLEAFGLRDANGKPRATHLYSMRQAIEEGFILDVLRGYATYKLFFNLTKAIDDDPRLDKKETNRAIARFVLLHPHNISQKVQIIVEHFRSVVMHKIGGKAKAMVVTDSRVAAVAYKQEVDDYLREKGYANIKALVAFSGTVKDDYDQEYTEAEMNGFGERQLPERFDTDEYKLLLVADKYQTGFDQPLLHTMYVDKKLSGVRAVQTLSRLNRTCPGKEDTFVLDFVNTPEQIKEAFQPFYESTTVEDNIDANQLYDLKAKLDASDVTRQSDIDAFAQVFFQPRNIQTAKDHARISQTLDTAVLRFREKPEQERSDYKSLLTSFLNLYSFLSQIMPFSDSELEKFYAYARLLATKLREESGQRVQIGAEIALEYYRLQKMSEGAITLDKQGEGVLRVPADVGTAGSEREDEALSNIIQVLNQRFGTEFNQGDQLFFDQIEHDLSTDAKLAQQAKSNSQENFRYPFDDVFIEKVIDRMEQNQEIADKIMNEDSFNEAIREFLLHRVYSKFRQKQ